MTATKAKNPKPAPRTPADLKTALAAAPVALGRFQAMPPSHRREHIQWITSAKRPETRAARISKAVSRILSGRRD